MNRKKIKKDLLEATYNFCGGKEVHAKIFVDELMGIIEDNIKVVKKNKKNKN